MTLVNNVNKAVLKWARERAGYSQADVAKKFSKSVDVVEAWEEGDEFPTYVQLETLAYSLYKIPLAVFFFPAPPDEIKVEQEFRVVPKAEIQLLSPNLLRIYRRAKAMIINLREICNDINPSKEQLLKQPQLKRNRPIDLAAEVREFFGISFSAQKESWTTFEAAFEGWRGKFESAGIFVFKEAFKNNDVSGFCLYDETFPVIYVNNSMPTTRQIFTLFHELAHLLLKVGGIDKYGEYYAHQSADQASVEVFCNKFAAEFLFPQNEFKKLINKLDINDDQEINKLSKYVMVSREVILRKYLDHGLITPDMYTQRVHSWKRHQKKRSGGNYYSNILTYLGMHYSSMVFGAYFKNRITIEGVADYLNVKEKSVPELEARVLKSMRKHEVHI